MPLKINKQKISTHSDSILVNETLENADNVQIGHFIEDKTLFVFAWIANGNKNHGK